MLRLIDIQRCDNFAIARTAVKRAALSGILSRIAVTHRSVGQWTAGPVRRHLRNRVVVFEVVFVRLQHTYLAPPDGVR